MVPAVSTDGPTAANWRLSVTVPADAVDHMTEALQRFSLSVASFGASPNGEWTVEAYLSAPPDPDRVAQALAAAAAAAGVDDPAVRVEPGANIDWLRANRDSFEPIHAGRFFIYPSHYDGPFPAGMVSVRVDAATAFGSGSHESTFGCLLAIDRLLPRLGAGPILDVGCGSGILSLAIARDGRRRVLAADIDPEAVRVTRANARANGVAGRVRSVRARGLAHRSIATGAPYPLIVANILARPLMGLARPIASSLRPGGYAVLSGLLAEQEAQVFGAYRRCGLALDRRITLNGWRTLVLRR